MMLTDSDLLWPLPYLDEQWNADTLFIMSSAKDDDALKAVVDRWNADADWVAWKGSNPYMREITPILRVWWA